MPRNTTTAEEEVDLGLWKLKQALCEEWQEKKKEEKKRTMIHCGLYTKGAKPSQEDLHEKVVNGGVCHLILLVLVFNLDSFTHMHVQGMFATEEIGCLRVPPSDINIKNNGEKNPTKKRLRIPPLHIHKKYHCFWCQSFFLCYLSI